MLPAPVTGQRAAPRPWGRALAWRESYGRRPRRIAAAAPARAAPHSEPMARPLIIIRSPSALGASAFGMGQLAAGPRATARSYSSSMIATNLVYFLPTEAEIQLERAPGQ